MKENFGRSIILIFVKATKMSYPEHPDTILIQNEFYQNGLKEIDIWNYYQKNKASLVKRMIGRNIIIFFATGINKMVVIRRMADESVIRFNMRNFDHIISGRTLSLHSTMKKTEDFGIIDLDVDNFNTAKSAAINVFNQMLEAPFVDHCLIKFTGKSSFHILVYFKRTMYIDGIREMLHSYISETYLIKKYTMEYKRKPGIVNLDISSNKFNGGFITEGSLSTIGLKSMLVDINKIQVFKKENAIIKIST